jgi:hypothetical protein
MPSRSQEKVSGRTSATHSPKKHGLSDENDVPLLKKTDWFLPNP